MTDPKWISEQLIVTSDVLDETSNCNQESAVDGSWQVVCCGSCASAALHQPLTMLCHRLCPDWVLCDADLMLLMCNGFVNGPDEPFVGSLWLLLWELFAGLVT